MYVLTYRYFVNALVALRRAERRSIAFVNKIINKGILGGQAATGLNQVLCP